MKIDFEMVFVGKTIVQDIIYRQSSDIVMWLLGVGAIVAIILLFMLRKGNNNSLDTKDKDMAEIFRMDAEREGKAMGLTGLANKIFVNTRNKLSHIPKENIKEIKQICEEEAKKEESKLKENEEDGK